MHHKLLYQGISKRQQKREFLISAPFLLLRHAHALHADRQVLRIQLPLLHQTGSPRYYWQKTDKTCESKPRRLQPGRAMYSWGIWSIHGFRLPKNKDRS